MTKRQEKQPEQQLGDMTPAQLVNKYGTKSAAIRGLLGKGYSRGEVSKMLKIRYQHVRNVEITPIKTEKKVAPKEISPEFQEALDSGL